MRNCGMAFETLADYQEGRADATTLERVRGHLASGCPTCQNHLALLGRTQAGLQAPPLVHAPERVLNSVSALFRERFQERYGAQKRPSFLARLIFDSRATLQLAGARGDDSTTCQQLYSTETHDIDLWQERQTANWYLIGQVLPHAGGAAILPESAVLTSNAGVTFQAMPEGGEFHLAEVPVGVYQLTLVLPEGEITLPDVNIGEWVG